MERLPAAFQPVLQLLLRATQYADDTGRDRWDFAVELSSLLTTGAGHSELRWLACKGYIAHAVETTLPGDSTRCFRPAGELQFPTSTCFVLTDAGAAALAYQETEVLSTSLPPSPVVATPRLNGHKPKPIWDHFRQELRVGEFVVKQFKVPAPNQETVLTVFEEEGWPVRIDDPLPPREEQDTKRRLHETITSLNRRQRVRLVRFMGDGSGQGVLWELIEPANSLT